MSTCDHICRECGQVMNCQHCRPYQLPVDRARIADLEASVRELVAHATGFTQRLARADDCWMFQEFTKKINGRYIANTLYGARLYHHLITWPVNSVCLYWL